MEDLKILHEIGVLQPDHALKLSEVLLGTTRSKKKAKMNDDDGGQKDHQM
jgi:hypothetical protein